MKIYAIGLVFFIIAIFALAFVVKDDDANVENKTNVVLIDSVMEICNTIVADSVPQEILIKKAYVVSYNKDTKIPNWVAWHLTAEHTDGPCHNSSFHEEEELKSFSATLDDYKEPVWDRGHMCPAADNRWDKIAMYESYSLVNVCPQNPNLNKGLWRSIENDCRQWAKKFQDIYIVCGPVFYRQEHVTIGENRVYVPEAFFKVVLCLNGKPKGLGIVVKNNSGTKKNDLYYNSIDQVERITGYDFFPALPDSIEDEVEAVVNMDLWK